MTQHRKQKFIPKNNHGHDIEGIISAPLIAAARANSKMQAEQTKFMMEFCFGKNGDSYDPVMIEMSLTKYEYDPNNPEKLIPYTTKFKIPLLTLVPMNSLAVENVNIDFEMEITSQTKATSQSNLSKSNQQEPQEDKTQLKGKLTNSYSNKSDSSSNYEQTKKKSSSLSVNVKAGTLPLPVGVTTILELYTKAIQPQKVNSSKTE